jgi:hypothetical protein
VELRGVEEPESSRIRGVIGRTGRLAFHETEPASEHMKRLSTHVVSDRAAKDAGITVEPAAWEDEKGDRQFDYHLVAERRDTLAGYLAGLGPEWLPDDAHQLAIERIDPMGDGDDAPARSPTWRTHYLRRAPALTGAHVSIADVTANEVTQRPEVLLRFDEAGSRDFADLTRRITGRKLAIVLDGNVMSAPVVQTAITGGRCVITMGGGDPDATRREAEDLARVLAAGALPVPLVERSASQLMFFGIWFILLRLSRRPAA